MSKYTVRYERGEDGCWVASVSEVPGCHTQARSLPAAEERIREALSLFVDDAGDAEFINQVVLPSEILKLRSEYLHVRSEVESLEERTRQSLGLVLSALVESTGLSTRDTGWLLDLSHQRVSQLQSKLKRQRKRKKGKRRAAAAKTKTKKRTRSSKPRSSSRRSA